MKKFFENYGLTALASIVVIVLIIIAAPVGNSIEGATTSMVGSFQNHVISSSKLIGNFEAINTPYTVNHHLMNLDGSTYTLDSTESLSGVADSTITPKVKKYRGFTAPTEQTITIADDGTTTIDYYYTRDKYTLDINGLLDDIIAENTRNYGTFSLYINGYLAVGNATDYWQKVYYGSTYEIKNIKALPGKKFVESKSSELKGSLFTSGETQENILLAFDTE